MSTTAVKERGILYSAPMVRAKLAGIKTQTRRIIKKPDSYTNIRDCSFCCPYGIAGEILWGRESHAYVPWASGAEKHVPEQEHDRTGVRYKATWDRSNSGRWRPSIHLHRWAARIIDEIVEVRVQRVQEISEADVATEGYRYYTIDAGSHCVDGMPAWKVWYMDLWNKINGTDSWESNPWVWAITTKPVKP